MKNKNVSLQITERLKFFGFNIGLKNNAVVLSISDLIINYITTKNEKQAVTSLKTLIMYASQYADNLNYARLTACRTTAQKQKGEIKTPEITPRKPIINAIKKPVITSKAPKIPPRFTSGDNAKFLANKYQERKAGIVEKADPIICTCSNCGETASNASDLKYIFGVNMTDRKIKMTCLDCK